ERHVEFGEFETQNWLKLYPKDRSFLLSSALIQLWGLRRLRKYILKKLLQGNGANHSVLKQFPAFYDHVILGFEERIERLGIAKKQLRDMGKLHRALLFVLLPLRWARRRMELKLMRHKDLLTKTYLLDPVVR